MNIDSPGSDGNYGAHRLQITGNYLGPAGSKAIDPNGFDVEILSNNRLRFWMTNLRPPVDVASGEFVDAASIGANSTVESFELVRGENELKWTGTFGANDGNLHSVNKVAADLNGGFVVSNDHSAPSKFWTHFPTTTLGECVPLTMCHSWSGMKLPNMKMYLFVLASNITLQSTAPLPRSFPWGRIRRPLHRVQRLQNSS